MTATYYLNKECIICHKKISDKNKSGYCRECYHKHGTLGKNNPFYGKHHSKDTIKRLKEACSAASKKKWEDDEYRKKVVANATGLRRSEKFKEKQREHALQQFHDKRQKDIRAIKMKQSWQNGKIHLQAAQNSNHSKQEEKLISLLENKIKEPILRNQTLRYKNQNGENKYIFPDGIIESKKLIIEYNGNFWHANPTQYKKTDIVRHGLTAEQIWARDKEKEKIYNDLGYELITVWQSDFVKDNKECINGILKIINNNKF